MGQTESTPKKTKREIHIEYKTYGDPTGAPLVLISGLAQQMLWPKPFLDLLVQHGYYVVTLDNLDIGLSTKFDAFGPANIKKILIQKTLLKRVSPKLVPYTLTEMAGDVIQVMDELKLDKANILGISMGGMI